MEMQPENSRPQLILPPSDPRDRYDMHRQEAREELEGQSNERMLYRRYVELLIAQNGDDYYEAGELGGYDCSLSTIFGNAATIHELEERLGDYSSERGASFAFRQLVRFFWRTGQRLPAARCTSRYARWLESRGHIGDAPLARSAWSFLGVPSPWPDPAENLGDLKAEDEWTGLEEERPDSMRGQESERPPFKDDLPF